MPIRWRAPLVEGVADGSPYLWDLIERAEGRSLTLLQSDPDAHLAALLAATTHAMAAARAGRRSHAACCDA